MAGSSTAVGSYTLADQAFATALGASAKAQGNSSLSLGYAANSSGTRAVALGSMSNAAGDDSFAMGNKAFANRKLSMAMGQNALANGTQSTVIGVSGETAVGAHNAIAMGYKSYVGAINADHPSVVATTNTGTTDPIDNKTSVSPIDGTVNYELSEDYYPVTTNDRTSTDPEKIYENSIALGMGAKSYGFQTLAIGGVAEAHDSNTIAVGLAAIAQGHYSVAMGQQARTSSNNALAIGHYAESHGEESTAIGYFSRVAGANNIALGNNTRLQGVNNSVALGSSARAQLNNSVAIGHNSAVLPDLSLNEAAYLTGEDYDLSHGAVSVGNIQYTVTAGNTSTTYLANTRRIMNVAGGFLDTDAVNVAQLKAALADINIQAADGITVNREGNKFTIGLNVEGVENPSNTVIIKPSETATENPTNPTEPTEPTDPTTPAESANPSYPNSGNPVQIGVDIKPIAVGGDRGNANVTPGAAFNVVGGDNITTTASEVTVNGTTVPKLEVALNKDLTGLNSVSTNGLTIKGADGKDTVVIKGDNISMGNNIIHDVKAGVKDNDAVNVSQLRQEIQGETRVSADGAFIKKDNTVAQNITALDNQVQANSESISSINDSITNLNGGVSNLSNQVSKLDNRLDRVGAGAAALAALHPQDFDPSAKWDFAAGYGNYKGANAVALGAFYRPSNDVMFSVGTSMGGGENMFNAGVSIKFGSSNEYSNYSKSALAQVVSDQASTIENLNSRVAKQEQENQELRAQIQEILNQLASK
ncbi:YadA-like family protein [Veillonella ratti]|uniref:YadA-like family protein n=1 Tax=Veillonella ratti TaxID=103892 RepID=UPI000F8C4DFF|nr:YadA-like family protein [Veillonella ratti]